MACVRGPEMIRAGRDVLGKCWCEGDFSWSVVGTAVTLGLQPFFCRLQIVCTRSEAQLGEAVAKAIKVVTLESYAMYPPVIVD